MSLSSLFPGMEAYLDGDITINNTVGAPSGDDIASASTTAAEQSAEAETAIADDISDAKDTEVATQMLTRMLSMYQHVKKFGIDRTFVALYNQNHELDKICNTRFPSCEAFSTEGDKYSRYTASFIAAMEDQKYGLPAATLEKLNFAFEKAEYQLPKTVKTIQGAITSRMASLQKVTQKFVQTFNNFGSFAYPAGEPGHKSKKDIELVSKWGSLQIRLKNKANQLVKAVEEYAAAVPDVVKGFNGTIAARWASKLTGTINGFRTEAKAVVKDSERVRYNFITWWDKPLDLKSSGWVYDSAKQLAENVNSYFCKAVTDLSRHLYRIMSDMTGKLVADMNQSSAIVFGAESNIPTDAVKSILMLLKLACRIGAIAESMASSLVKILAHAERIMFAIGHQLASGKSGVPTNPKNKFMPMTGNPGLDFTMWSAQQAAQAAQQAAQQAAMVNQQATWNSTGMM